MTFNANLLYMDDLLTRVHANYLAHLNLQMSIAGGRMSRILNRMNAVMSMFVPMTLMSGIWGRPLLFFLQPRVPLALWKETHPFIRYECSCSISNSGNYYSVLGYFVRDDFSYHSGVSNVQGQPMLLAPILPGVSSRNVARLPD